MSMTKQARVVKRVFNRAVGLPLKRLLYHAGLVKGSYIDPDGLVRLRKLEIYLTNGCNLKCKFCSHFNPYRRGIVATETLVTSMVIWSKKVRPKKFGLLGGEPLMHPDFSLLLRKARECWPTSRLIVTTNGLLVAPKGGALVDVLHETGAEVLLSEHLTNEKGRAVFATARTILENAKIPTTVIPSASRWKEYYFFDDHGKPLPYQSRPEASWTMCGPNTCFNLTNNKLYRCSILANAACGWQEGALGDEWKCTQTYKPLEPTATADEIVRHLFLMTGPLVACSICPETIRFVDARQIATEEADSK
ncbi:MAG: radical SAM protein [Planctomycetaceae bacterium]|nr:radical SAM protein [Planctomycetaceae bacterium]